MDRHRFDADTDPDPNFHCNTGPDSDWHQNDANSHADPIQCFAHIRKSEFFYTFTVDTAFPDLISGKGVIIFRILDSIEIFWKKHSLSTYSLVGIYTDPDRPDPDPTRS
jgi:hypothetical protein